MDERKQELGCEMVRLKEGRMKMGGVEGEARGG